MKSPVVEKDNSAQQCVYNIVQRQEQYDLVIDLCDGLFSEVKIDEAISKLSLFIQEEFKYLGAIAYKFRLNTLARIKNIDDSLFIYSASDGKLYCGSNILRDACKKRDEYTRVKNSKFCLHLFADLDVINASLPDDPEDLEVDRIVANNFTLDPRRII